jgi:hypothetical protein
VRQQVANGRLPRRGRGLGRPPPEPLRIRGSVKADRMLAVGSAAIQAALLSQLLMRLVPGGPPVREQQLSRHVRCGHSPGPLADPGVPLP